MRPEPTESGHPKMVLWHRSPQAVRFMFGRYVPIIALGNLAWEFLHLPLYTLWNEGNHGAMVFAVLHCTGGDVMIGTAALLIAVLLFGRYGWPRAKHGPVLGAAILGGVAYTVWSEWVNTEVTMEWQYTEAMLRIPPFGTGITPVLQWLVVPSLAYGLAYSMGARRATAGSMRQGI